MNGEHCLLTGADYGQIQQTMLAAEPTMRPALVRITSSTSHDAIAQIRPVDFSFSRQMRQLFQKTVFGQPDAFFFTATSAIPVADAVRGYYEALDLQTPLLGVVSLSKRSRGLTPDDAKKAQKPEVNRLSQLIDSNGPVHHAVIVDQFCATNRTLVQAGKLLLNAGVERVTGIRGNWYELAYPSEVKREDVTSDHATFMHRIGAQAVQDIADTNILRTVTAR